MGATMRPLVLYHNACCDGYGAAFACWQRYKGDGADYIPMDYMRKDATPQDLLAIVGAVAGRTVYIVDFSLPKHLMQYIFTCAENTVWIDHHKAAFEMWLGYYNKGMRYTKRSKDERVEIILDDNRSGAWLTWCYFNPSKTLTIPPTLFMLIDDRDRWQFKMKGSVEAHAALMALRPWTFYKWSIITIPDLLEVGGKIMQYQNAQIDNAMQHAQSIHIPVDTTIAGMFDDQVKGLAVNARDNVSEIGHRLATASGTFGCCWSVDGAGTVWMNLRSTDAGADVSDIAKRHGGGGHRNAAGFKTDLMTIARWLKCGVTTISSGTKGVSSMASLSE